MLNNILTQIFSFFIPLIPTQKIFLSLLPYPEYMKLQSSNSQQCNLIAAGLLEISI